MPEEQGPYEPGFMGGPLKIVFQGDIFNQQKIHFVHVLSRSYLFRDIINPGTYLLNKYNVSFYDYLSPLELQGIRSVDLGVIHGAIETRLSKHWKVCRGRAIFGLRFNVKGGLNGDLLLARNSQSALGAMRGLQSLGLHSAGFSRLLSAKLYAAFIRPKPEFGLSISWLLKRHLKLVGKAQNQCPRLAFGSHRASSVVVVFRHLTNLPTTEERVDVLMS
ncbi:hypothetical protein MBANPS3_002000 [Mucor bainieri]